MPRAKVTVCLFLAACGAYAQSAPAFEVASIREAEFPNDAFFAGFSAAGTCGSAPVKISGNRVSVTMASVCALIRFAYGVPAYRLAGVPGWMSKADRSAYYDIQATAAGDAALSQDQIKAMLKTLLADRFQVKIHTETRDLPVYNLVVAKGGPKLSTEPLPPQGVCGDRQAMIAALESLGRGTSACKPTVSMAQLASTLTGEADRPVIDATGLTGQYAYKLRWSPEGKDLGPDAPPGLYTAIQDQLGLKLEPVKAPLEFVVIERAERPSTN